MSRKQPATAMSKHHGMLICLLGLDGSGKSTQAQHLVAHLRSAGYQAAYVWAGRRATFSAPLVRLGKARFKAPRRPQAASVATNESYRSYVAATKHMFKRQLVRNAWQQLTIVEHLVQLWGQVVPRLLRGTTVVCDRYIYDTLIGQNVYFGATPNDFVRALHAPTIALAPRPALGFWLDIPPTVALKRKADIYDLQQLEARTPFYSALAKELGFQRLDATLAPDALADTIWLSVLRQITSRNFASV